MNARLGVLLAVALAATSCSGDDDTAPTTTRLAVTSPTFTAAPTTADPSTLPPTTSTLPATTTTVDPVEALKAEVAAAFLRSERLRDELAANPMSEGLETRLSFIAVPGSPMYTGYVTYIRDLVEHRERIVPGTPDLSSVRVESVELVGDPSSGQALVTACDVNNRVRIGPDGMVVGDSGDLSAARIQMPMQRTASGWLETGEVTPIAIQKGATECPAS